MFNKTIISMSGFIFCHSNPSFCLIEEGDLLEKIANHEKTCVEHIQHNKIYLKASKLYPTDDGLYLELSDDVYIPLRQLSSDSQGCYIPILSKKITKKCPLCGREYLLICPDDNCPSNQKRKKRKC